MKSNLQVKLAIASFIVAVAFSVAGFIIPPTGDLTDANLYLVAQFLLVTTSILGVSAVVAGRPPTILAHRRTEHCSPLTAGQRDI